LARIGTDGPTEAGNAAGTRPAKRTEPSRVIEAPATEKPATERPATVSWHPPSAPGRVSPVVRRLARELGVDLATVTPTGPSGGITRADVEGVASPRGPTREPAAPAAPAARRRVSPRARTLAAARGAQLETVEGTGPGGAVVADDVPRRRANATPPADGTPRAEKADKMRAAIARAMARSKREIPHYYLSTDIDFSAARAFLDSYNEERTVADRVLPAALLLKACALGLHEAPELNGRWEDDRLQMSSSVHLGVAIALRGGGLVAPAIHDADSLSLDDLMSELRDLVGRARAGSSRASEIADPTITVTNLGDQGVPAVYGVIYPPQVALVGFGAITERAWAADGMVGPRPVVTATLSADHRASDGIRGARLLVAIDRLLQEPEAL
jgi:pyruvate dehydrogenase E2 component (dihydrolipoamide acetyltransferase)